MVQHILRYTGGSAVPDADLAAIRARAGVNVLDHSGRTVLVEATEAAARGLVHEMPGWAIDPVRLYAIPDTRPKLKDSPDG